jgi:hypothetical protein
MRDDFKDAREKGVAFLCATCTRWAEGVDKGIMNRDGEQVCSRSQSCHGPLSGGSFEEYDGPIRGYLAKFCHVCGCHATKAISPKGVESRIGVCDSCLAMLRGLTPSIPGRKIVFTTANRAGDDKYEVNS